MNYLFPAALHKKFDIQWYNHANTILKNDFKQQWSDLKFLLENFRLNASDVVRDGGRKTAVAETIDSMLYNTKRWNSIEYELITDLIIPKKARETVSIKTHEIDCVSDRVALEVEWNNKDPFYDRDLSNFKLLHEAGAISVGIIVTRCSELQTLFDELGVGKKYGKSTTHMEKLEQRIRGRVGGGCPLITIGIKKELYNCDINVESFIRWKKENPKTKISKEVVEQFKL